MQFIAGAQTDEITDDEFCASVVTNFFFGGHGCIRCQIQVKVLPNRQKKGSTPPVGQRQANRLVTEGDLFNADILSFCSQSKKLVMEMQADIRPVSVAYFPNEILVQYFESGAKGQTACLDIKTFGIPDCQEHIIAGSSAARLLKVLIQFDDFALIEVAKIC